MKTINVNIDNKNFTEMGEILAKVKKSRNSYINEALTHYNSLQLRILLEKKLRKESHIVREDSMNTLKDFEDIEDL
jgi:hypothetical protein